MIKCDYCKTQLDTEDAFNKFKHCNKCGGCGCVQHFRSCPVCNVSTWNVTIRDYYCLTCLKAINSKQWVACKGNQHHFEGAPCWIHEQCTEEKQCRVCKEHKCDVGPIFEICKAFGMFVDDNGRICHNCYRVQYVNKQK